MNTQKNKLRTYLFSSVILSLISAVLYYFAYIREFDASIGYFGGDAVFHRLAVAMLCISALWLASSLLLIPKDALAGDAPKYSRLSRYFSAVSALGIIICSLVRLIVPGLMPTGISVSVFVTLFGLIASVYFIMTAIGSSSSLRPLFGYVVILWATLSLTEAYLNNYVAMNSPIKTLLMLSMISVMLFTLFDIRFFVSKPMPRGFFAVTMVGMCVCLAFSLPYIISALTSGILISEYLTSCMMILILSFFMYSRLLDFVEMQIDSVEQVGSVAEKADDTEDTEESEPEK